MEMDVPGAKAAEHERKEQLLDAAFEVASREGLDGLTVRRVAAEAGLSHGLVHFHFRTKELLLLALLDRLLERTVVLDIGSEAAGDPSPLDRLVRLLRQEMRRLSSDRTGIRLFFDFWLMGTRNRRVRARIRGQLERYREAFRPTVEEVLNAEPERFAHVTPEGLSVVVVAFIKGSAVQSVIDPKGFDIAQFTAAADALLSQLEAGRG